MEPITTTAAAQSVISPQTTAAAAPPASRERRTVERYAVALTVEVGWLGEDGVQISSRGTTENIGMRGFLIHLPRQLPPVGRQVMVTFLREDRPPFIAEAIVLRLVRNFGHPQVAFEVSLEEKLWKAEIFDYAALLAAESCDESDDW